jgi:molybdopterin synthase sulfur carrier subunit
MSTITFEFYGRLESLAQASQLALELPLPISIEQAIQQLAEQKPEISTNLERCACAIGDELVSRSTLLESESRIALLPPVAGG